MKELIEVNNRAIDMNIPLQPASCALYIEMGMPVYLSKGSEKNFKITTPEDIEIFKALLEAKRPDWLKL